ncbi:MAG: hypothetical protein JWO92_2527 [Chitinophagaceae bacterium]|nr:hypothetical protein [Chitinophagaceae bacterium]
MKIQTFKHGYKSGWEINFSIGNYSLRIANHQIAFWNNYNSLINLLF